MRVQLCLIVDLRSAVKEISGLAIVQCNRQLSTLVPLLYTPTASKPTHHYIQPLATRMQCGLCCLQESLPWCLWGFKLLVGGKSAVV